MKKRLLAGAGLLAAARVAWLVAQNSAQPDSLASLFPGGAFVYVEARDFSALLKDWNASSEKRLWLTSSNYDVFSRTRLFMRLADAQQEFADTAGLRDEYVAGELDRRRPIRYRHLRYRRTRVPVLTRLPSAQVLASTPFSARSAYES